MNYPKPNESFPSYASSVSKNGSDRINFSVFDGYVATTPANLLSHGCPIFPQHQPRLSVTWRTMHQHSAGSTAQDRQVRLRNRSFESIRRLHTLQISQPTHPLPASTTTRTKCSRAAGTTLASIPPRSKKSAPAADSIELQPVPAPTGPMYIKN